MGEDACRYIPVGQLAATKSYHPHPCTIPNLHMYRTGTVRGSRSPDWCGTSTICTHPLVSSRMMLSLVVRWGCERWLAEDGGRQCWFSKGPTRQSSPLHQSVLSQKTPKDQLPHAYLAPPPAYSKRILSLAQPRSHPNDPPSLPSTQRHLDSPPRCLGLASTRISPACHLARHAEPSKLDAVQCTINTDIALTSPSTGRAPPPL